MQEFENIASIKDKAKQDLLALEEQFNNDTDAYNQALEKAKEDEDALLADLEKKLADYDAKHNPEAEEKKAFNSRDLVFRLKKGQISKIIGEATDKISTLEKECFDKINALENDVAKVENDYNSKTSDHERKAKYEVKKISDAILTPKFKDDNPIEIDPILATEEELAQKYKKEAEHTFKVRIEGINKIYELKNEFYTFKKDSDLDYISKKNELKEEIELTKNAYDIDITNSKHVVREESNRLRDEEYFANFNALLNLATVELKNALEIGNKKIKTYDAIKKLHEDNDKLNEVGFNYKNARLDLIKATDEAIISEVFKFEETMFDFDNSEVLIANIENGLTNLIIREYLDSFGQALFTSFKDNVLDKVSKVASLASEKQEKGKLDYHTKVASLVAAFKNNLLKELESFVQDEKSIASKELSEERANLNLLITDHQNWYLEKQDEINNAKNMAKHNYNDKCEQLKKEKQDYVNEKAKDYILENLDFKNNMVALKEQPKLIKQKYAKAIKVAKENAMNEYRAIMAFIKEEKEEKTLMCK